MDSPGKRSFAPAVRALIQVLFGVVLSSLGGAAAEHTFRLEALEKEAPEGGTITTQVLVTDAHRFSLKFPERWGVQVVSSNQTLMILEPSLRAGIQLRFWPQESQEPEELKAWLREKLETRQKDEVVIGQFKTRGAASDGWGVDLVRLVDRKTQAGLRLILVPYPGGMAEFELRAPMAEVSDYYRVLRHLVASFGVVRDQENESLSTAAR
jgi:hypothetical protein